MEAAERDGRLRLLAHGEQVGYTIFETPDQRQLMHLGHPNTTWDGSSEKWNATEPGEMFRRPKISMRPNPRPSGARTATFCSSSGSGSAISG